MALSSVVHNRSMKSEGDTRGSIVAAGSQRLVFFSLSLSLSVYSCFHTNLEWSLVYSNWGGENAITVVLSPLSSSPSPRRQMDLLIKSWEKIRISLLFNQSNLSLSLFLCVNSRVPSANKRL